MRGNHRGWEVMWQGGKEATQRGGGIPRLRNATSRQAGRKKRRRVPPLGMTSGGLFPGEKASRSFTRNDNVFGYLREKRSKSAIWRSISSRAASEAERMPWMRSLNSSALEARSKASSWMRRVLSGLMTQSRM